MKILRADEDKLDIRTKIKQEPSVSNENNSKNNDISLKSSTIETRPPNSSKILLRFAVFLYRTLFFAYFFSIQLFLLEEILNFSQTKKKTAIFYTTRDLLCISLNTALFLLSLVLPSEGLLFPFLNFPLLFSSLAFQNSSSLISSKYLNLLPNNSAFLQFFTINLLFFAKIYKEQTKVSFGPSKLAKRAWNSLSKPLKSPKLANPSTPDDDTEIAKSPTTTETRSSKLYPKIPLSLPTTPKFVPNPRISKHFGYDFTSGSPVSLPPATPPSTPNKMTFIVNESISFQELADKLQKLSISDKNDEQETPVFMKHQKDENKTEKMEVEEEENQENEENEDEKRLKKLEKTTNKYSFLGWFLIVPPIIKAVIAVYRILSEKYKS